MRIVFMGTPAFAEESLTRLIDEGFNVAAVFTRPDKPKNRGMKIVFSPVKEAALLSGIPVYQPARPQDDEAALREIAPDLIVVVAYGRILSDDILAIPRLGAVNVHASLLPKHRGAAPVQWAVLSGDETTGVSTMYLASELDAGDVIYTDETGIGEFETAGELYERLKIMGAELLIKTVRDIENGVAPRTPQDHGKATFTGMLDKSMSPIAWNKTPREIVRQINGLQPWPVATAVFAGATFKIFSAEYTDERTIKAPGSLIGADKNGLLVACAAGETLLIKELQAPGGKRMPASDYLRGHPMAGDEG